MSMAIINTIQVTTYKKFDNEKILSKFFDSKCMLRSLVKSLAEPVREFRMLEWFL